MPNQSRITSVYETETDEHEYIDCVSDLISHDKVRSMANFPHHGDVNRLEHCLYVSYTAYRLCKQLGLDHRAAARGGLLHDFFLYDWREVNGRAGLHGIGPVDKLYKPPVLW